jgi:hypothetical protein
MTDASAPEVDIQPPRSFIANPSGEWTSCTFCRGCVVLLMTVGGVVRPTIGGGASTCGSIRVRPDAIGTLANRRASAGIRV